MSKIFKKICDNFIVFFKRIFVFWKIKSCLKKNEKIFIEVGSGDKSGTDGWLTIDMTRKCDLFWDLRNGIPFPNESVSKIYSSHFFEHLTFKECQVFLDECLRVMVPGGIFSICVPDAKIYLQAYLDPKVSLDKIDYFGYRPAFNNTTKIDYVNYTAYMDGHHKYMFDEDNLIYILNSKGFENVHLRDFSPDLDVEERDFESIYAEATK